MRIVLLHGLLTDLSPPGLARLVADPLEGDVLLVGNDTGSRSPRAS